MSTYRRPGGKIWWVRFQAQGREIRQSARTTSRAVARKVEADLREQHNRIARGGGARRSYREAMERFIVEHHPSLRPRAAQRYLVSARALHPHFADLYLDQIGKAQLGDYIADRRQYGVADATIRRDLACLSSMFSLAMSWDWADRNPVRTLNRRQVKEAAPRTRYLTTDEYTRLLRAAKPYLKPLIVFAVETGLRLEEQLSLRWTDMDLDRCEATIVGKGGKRRVIALSPVALGTISGTVHPLSKHVFCKPSGERYGKLTRGLAGTCKRAKIADLRWHDLRRTCGSWMLQRGVDIHVVSRYLGHASVVVTERAYAFLRTEDFHRAMGTKPGTGTRIS